MFSRITMQIIHNTVKKHANKSTGARTHTQNDATVKQVSTQPRTHTHTHTNEDEHA